MFIILSIIIWFFIFFINKYEITIIYPGFRKCGGGGKKGGSKTTIEYKWTFGLADIIAYEKPLITFEARLGNIILIGDDSTTVAYIPCYWMKKYFYAKGYGYFKTYPYTIRLFKNSLENELIENTDFTYDNTTGKITFLFTPQKGDFIGADFCYDEEYKEETSFYADFSFNDIYRRLGGFKYYKYQDDGLNTYLKCCTKAKHFLSELYKPLVYGSYDIVFNPKVEIGKSIYINHIIPNVQRIFFIDKIRESHSKKTHTTEISGISFPEVYEIINRFRQEHSGDRLDFYLPDTILSFIDSKHDDGLYFIGKANKVGQNIIDVNYHSPLELKISKSDEYKIFPGAGFEPNTRDIAVFRGRIYQWYDISFSNSPDTYEEFDDENVFFAKRLVNFQLYNTADNYEMKNKAVITFIGRKELLSKGNNIAPYASGDHILFFDKDGDFWLCDYRFATNKRGQMESGDLDSSEINLIGSYNHCFALFDNTLKEFDVDNQSWSNLGNLTHNYPLKNSERKFCIDIDDYRYIFSQANISGGVGNYNNYLDVLKYKTGNVTEINYCNETGVADYKGGVPITFDKWVFWGKSAWELYDKTYTAGHLPDLPAGNPSVYYTTNYDKSVLWAVVCIDQTNSLTDSYGTGKKWVFYRRPSSDVSFNWTKIGTVEFTNDMTIIPIGDTNNGLILYLKGSDLQSVIHPDTDCAIGLLHPLDDKIQLKMAKVEGESDSIYNHSFFMNQRLYLNWKDYTDLYGFDTVGEIAI